MRVTKAQAAALVDKLLELEVDDRLLVRAEEDPYMDVPGGVLRVTLRDRWGREVVRIDRQGIVSQPPSPPVDIPPGQTSIPLD